MDPFVVVELNGKKQQTKVHNNGGKKPVWNDTLTFSLLGSETFVKILVYDKDPFSNDFVCQATVPLHPILEKKHQSSWISCEYKQKNAGQIFVTFEVLGSNKKEKIDNQQHMNFAQQGIFQMPGMGGFAPQQQQPQINWPTQAHPTPSMIPHHATPGQGMYGQQPMYQPQQQMYQNPQQPTYQHQQQSMFTPQGHHIPQAPPQQMNQTPQGQYPPQHHQQMYQPQQGQYTPQGGHGGYPGGHY